MSKHTPGPWSIEKFYGSDNVSAIEPNVLWGCGCCGSPNLGLKDAQLIAAAPDLLNALTVLADACEKMNIPVDAAKAAIAKARGE
jgi:hypothetical protein